ncbi:hypothetical protein BGX30_007919, partial [Mortierella sp. GBA39]
MDCQGHGSHVAGIVGGDARHITGAHAPPQPFVGVAPEVTLGAYRVFGCDGSSGTDVLLAAMEKAFNDGMNIINMSLGGGSSYKGNPTAALGDKLAKRGLTLIASAGNDGSEGVWMVGNTGLGDDSTSVASFTNAYGRFQTFNYAGGKYSYSPAANFGTVIDLPASATLVPLFDKAGVLQDGCDAASYTGVPVAGKVVLALGDYTRCGSGARATIAKNAGAAGLLTATTPSGYAVLSGTSMSSPYVAGSQALFYQGKKNGPRGLETRKIFKNTATLTKLWKGKNLVSAAKQGSGLINVM